MGEGTLFLDEIGSLPIALQPKLLRVLQDNRFYMVGETTPKKFQGRIIIATKEDLDYVMEVLPGIVEKLRQISPIRMEVGQKEVSHPEVFAGQGTRVKVGGKTYK